ncbi:ABC transporter ATP-binding protein [Candidatus Bathyarchaeota archaeon]|nr:ABC transporter ATP-binding protein [Candidatus Bathyarchaeota archaeon]
MIKMKSEPLLELKDVTHEYRVGGGLGIIGSKSTIKALNSISFSVPSEKPVVIGLIGESGSGKTTIARLILGLLEPTYGKVLYKGKPVAEWLKKNKLAYLKEVQPIFQDPYSIYNPFYRVERILKVSLKKLKIAREDKVIEDMIISAMKDIGLRPEDILGRYPHQLSGGERQRLMLARMLLIKPRLIVADEPVSMIDASLRAIFLDQARALKDKIGASCLYITHDLDIANCIADSLIVLCQGNIVEEGSTGEIINEPLHPYTKLLLSSIPAPNPKSRWKDQMELAEATSVSEQARVEKGCIFWLRCPYAMDVCKKERPPMVEVEPSRRVLCFLYVK